MTWNNTQPQPNQFISQGQGTILNDIQFLGNNAGNTQPGFMKFPNGLIMQWGIISITTVGNKTQNYPIAFPNQVFSLQFSQGWTMAGNAATYYLAGGAVTVDTSTLPLSLTAANFRVSLTPAPNTITLYWFAIGN